MQPGGGDRPPQGGTRPGLLRDVPRVPRILVLTGPLFAPAMLAGPYAIAYQDALGLTAGQIGLVASATAALSFAFLLLGAAASERWGRLRALSLFDLLGFVLPGVLLALARTPGEVVLALLLGATAQGAQAGFQGLLMADLAPGQRQRVLAVEHLLLALPGAAMPLVAGAAVATWGLEAAVRALYFAGAASVAVMVLVRWVTLRGIVVPPGPAGVPELRGLRASSRAMARAGLAPVLAASGLLAFAAGLGVLGQVRVLDLGIAAPWLGAFAFAMTAADLGATAVAARGRAGGRTWAVAGAVLGAAGSVLFVLAREPVVLLASGAAYGVAGAWAGVGLGAMLHDPVPEALRERAATAQVAARTLAGVAGPVVGAALFTADPAAPWWAAAGLSLGVGLVLAVRSKPSGNSPRRRNGSG